MLILSVVHIAFGAVALICCGAAMTATVRRSPNVGYYLMLAGGFAFVFFMSVPRVRIEMPLIALAAIVTGFALAPAAPPIGSGDLDIGESTATRRLRK